MARQYRRIFFPYVFSAVLFSCPGLINLQPAGMTSAAGHLKPGGVLLVVGKTAETFQNNNFVYTGEKNGIDITLFENNHIYKTKPDSYEATLVYLIRRHGELTTHIDRHELGLFSQEKWELVFADCDLELHQHALDGAYDEYLLENGAYPMQVFIEKKAG